VEAQEQFVDPPSKLISSFPFKLLTGGVILLKAKVNNYPDSLNFVLDTGSGGISLDSNTVAEFKIPVVESGKTIKGIGGIRKVSFLYNKFSVLVNTNILQVGISSILSLLHFLFKQCGLPTKRNSITGFIWILVQD